MEELSGADLMAIAIEVKGEGEINRFQRDVSDAIRMYSSSNDSAEYIIHEIDLLGMSGVSPGFWGYGGISAAHVAPFIPFLTIAVLAVKLGRPASSMVPDLDTFLKEEVLLIERALNRVHRAKPPLSPKLVGEIAVYCKEWAFREKELLEKLIKMVNDIYTASSLWSRVFRKSHLSHEEKTNVAQ